MTENAEFIPGLDDLEDVQDEKQLIDFNVNDANIALAAEEFKDVDAYKDIEAAKAAKKVLTKMRTTLAEAHKEQKAGALAYGRKLDGEKNRLLAAITAIEGPISKQLTDIKNEALIKEEARVAAIMEHIERLQSYSLERHDLDLEQIKERRANLAAEVFEADRYQEFLGDAKMAAEEADTKLRIVLQRELDAVEEREKLAVQQKEMAEQQEAMDKQQATMDAQAAATKADQDRRDEEAAAEQKAKDDERQAELNKQAEEQAAAQKVLDDEAAEKVRAAKAEEDAAAELAKAPDRDKLRDFATQIDKLIHDKPTMESQEGANTMLFAVGELITIVETVRECVEEMK